MAIRWAVLSDIHGNLEALEAVLADAERQGAEKIAVLGDVIDYGPDPVRCLERVREVAEVWLIGNHEAHAIRADPAQCASDVLRWSRPLLEASGAWADVRRRVAADGLRAHASRIVNQRHFVHASARHPIAQYVWPGHECQYLVFNRQIDERLAGFLQEFEAPLGFNGHTHVPALLTSYTNHRLLDAYRGIERHPVHTFVGPSTIFFVPGGSCVIRGVEGARMVINAGSVGQPRQLGDNRASYVLSDDDTLEFRRIDYAWGQTAAKLAALPIDTEQRAELIERLERGI